MATPEQKAQCVIWFIETGSVIIIKRDFRCEDSGNELMSKTDIL